MYVRVTERLNEYSSVVRYSALAHNQRVAGTTKTNVLLDLDREDRLDPAGLRRLVSSMNRYLGESDPDAGTDAPAATGAHTATDGLQLIASRPAGAARLLDGLWKTLDIDTALRKVIGGRRFTIDVERVLFALVANRAIDPASEPAAAGWAGHDVAIPGLDGMDDDRAYRAMDLLVEADTDASVQEAVFFAVADLLDLEVACCSSTPPAPTSNATPKIPTRWPQPGRGSRCGAGAGPGTPATRSSCPRSATVCVAGAWAGS